MSEADRLKNELSFLALSLHRTAREQGIALNTLVPAMTTLFEIIDRAVEQAHAELRAEAELNEIKAQIEADVIEIKALLANRRDRAGEHPLESAL